MVNFIHSCSRIIMDVSLNELENEFSSFREAQICLLNRIGISFKSYFTIYIITMEPTAHSSRKFSPYFLF